MKGIYSLKMFFFFMNNFTVIFNADSLIFFRFGAIMQLLLYGYTGDIVTLVKACPHADTVRLSN